MRTAISSAIVYFAMSLLACAGSHDDEDLGAGDLKVGQDLAAGACSAAGGVCVVTASACVTAGGNSLGGALGCSYMCCLPPPQCTFTCDLAQCPCATAEAVCEQGGGSLCVCAPQTGDAGSAGESVWSCALGPGP